MTDKPTIVIEATPDTIPARLAELWRYRGFFAYLFKELLMRRARGTALGFWLLLLRPLLPVAGMIFAFTAVRPVDTGGAIPYPLFLLSGYLPFQLFQSSMRFIPRSLSQGRSLMVKTYFPRLLVPMASFGYPGMYAAVMLGAFIIVTILATVNTGTLPIEITWRMLWVIPAVLQSLCFSLAIGTVLGVVALFFRDIIFTARFGASFFLVVTPVIYPIEWIPEAWRWLLYLLNPLAQSVIVSRWALTGEGAFEPGYVALSWIMTLALLAAAFVFFLRAERFLGDQM